MKKILMILSTFMMIAVPLSACDLSNASGSESITIGTQTNTDVKIMAQMYKQIIEDNTDISVDIKTDLATTPVVVEAMESDDVQMATQYTGTSLASFASSIKHPKDQQATLEQAKDVYKEKFNIKWFDALGYANNYALAVRKDFAEEHNLENISDLKGKAKDMTAAFDTSWLERENDGYDAFKDAYNIEIGKTSPMEIGLVYDAVNEKGADIALAYTVDARIDKYNFEILEDDKKFFPHYDASPVVKQEVLDEHPEISEAIDPLLGHFDNKVVRELSGEVNIEGKDPKEVAQEYLEKQDLIN